MQGKFIVIYGPPNIGKSTQVRLLKEKLEASGQLCWQLKYPLYNLEPTGPLIDAHLRRPATLLKPYTELEFQKLCIQNRLDNQPNIIRALEQGQYVIAEDYKATGIAWGVTRGLNLQELEELNKDLIEPDLIIFMDSQTRFLTGIEPGHINEDAGEAIWQASRDIHRQLAQRYGWQRVEADQSVELVHKAIMQVINPFLQPNLVGSGS